MENPTSRLSDVALPTAENAGRDESYPCSAGTVAPRVLHPSQARSPPHHEHSLRTDLPGAATGNPTRCVTPRAVPGWEAVTASAGTDFSLCLKISRGFTALCAISDAASCQGEESTNPALKAPQLRDREQPEAGSGADAAPIPQQSARVPGGIPALSPPIRFS